MKLKDIIFCVLFIAAIVVNYLRYCTEKKILAAYKGEDTTTTTTT